MPWLAPLDWMFIFFPAMIGAVFGAVFLLTAIAFHNMIAGGAEAPGSVAASFAKALGITFATALVNVVVGIGVVLVLQATPAALYVPVGISGLLSQVVALPLSLLVMAAMFTAVLPTSFGRAVVIMLLYLAMATVLTLLIVGVLVVGLLVMRHF